MTASKREHYFLSPLRGIIRYMSNFEDMSKLVQFIKVNNDARVKKHQPKVAKNDQLYYSLLLEKKEVLALYAKAKNIDEQKVRDIYGDATSKRFGYIREHKTPYMPHAEVTSAGRTLIKTKLGGQIRTGYYGEIIEKSSKKVAIVASVVITLAAVANAVLVYYSHR